MINPKFAELFELSNKRTDLQERVAKAEGNSFWDGEGILRLDVAEREIGGMRLVIEEIIDGFSDDELKAYADYRRERRAREGWVRNS